MQNMKLAGLVALTFAAACTTSDASLTVINDSDFVIDELRVTEVDNPNYGPNLIPDALLPGESVTIDVSCDYYDVLMVDETGTQCELFDLDLCLNDAEFVITNNTCTVFGAREQPAETSPRTQDQTSSQI